MTTTLWADGRYVGHHGIARYANEVLRRISGWQRLPLDGSPTSPTGYLHRGWRVPAAHDLIYSPGFGTGRSRAPQVLTVHDLIHLEDAHGPQGLAHRAYYGGPIRRAIRQASAVCTVSETSARALRAWLGDEVTVINTGNGCSAAFRADGPVTKARRPYVLFVGNLKSHKNPRVAFEAVARLREFDLVVVTSETAESVLSLALAHGISDRTTRMSDLDDDALAALYRGASALIFPSLREGFGLPAVESLRCGTPVVYYEGCESVAEICGGGQYPVAEARDADAFARAIAAAVGRPAPDTKGLERYNWDAVAERVGEALNLVRDRHAH